MISEWVGVVAVLVRKDGYSCILQGFASQNICEGNIFMHSIAILSTLLHIHVWTTAIYTLISNIELCDTLFYGVLCCYGHRLVS